EAFLGEIVVAAAVGLGVEGRIQILELRGVGDQIAVGVHEKRVNYRREEGIALALEGCSGKFGQLERRDGFVERAEAEFNDVIEAEGEDFFSARERGSKAPQGESLAAIVPIGEGGEGVDERF